MVFGRKQTATEAVIKPSPPSIDQILEDLKKAESDDPVFRLNPSKLVETEAVNPEAERNYREVTEYTGRERQISQLQEKIVEGFDTLVSSQKELESLSSSVADQLEIIKKERSKIDLKTAEATAGVGESGDKASEEESGEDLCWYKL